MRLALVRIVAALLGSLAVMASAAAHQGHRAPRPAPSAPPFQFDGVDPAAPHTTHNLHA